MRQAEAELVVIGAGAAGLLAAAVAARGGVRTLVLEKARQPGIKILIAGGGHCNLTHQATVREMLVAFGPAAPFLAPAMRRFSPRRLRRWLAARGVPTWADASGKVWPRTRRARDVRDALVAEVRAAGALLWTEAPALAVRRREEGFEVLTPRGAVHSQRLLVTTGGRSYPKTGTTGDGYRFLTALGHTLVRPVPALVPLRVPAIWVRELAGVSVADVALTLTRPADGAVLDRARGALLFTHRGLSGPAALDVSAAAARAGARTRLLVDWLPGHSTPEVAAAFQAARAEAGRRHVAGLLAAWLPHRLARTLADLAGLGDRQLAQLRRPERERLLRVLKQTEVEVAGTLGFDRAEVTAGGIALAEVEPETMASRLVPGLYIAGEILDYCGRLGGYNLQAAFSTGYVAGAAQLSRADSGMGKRRAIR